MKSESTSLKVKEILAIEVPPALGCTEPVAIALSCAAAASLLPDRDFESIAAGTGATAGITHLPGGDLHYIAGAIMNLVEDFAGVICDGQKQEASLLALI